ncbi:hypothetical protein B0H10DRAFT_403603 [Mycena sp. CBHHK59/15]|nr:hypothetical protein B0H10DRAFT_403603 [Mycena sp. CBHHK59/15]
MDFKLAVGLLNVTCLRPQTSPAQPQPNEVPALDEIVIKTSKYSQFQDKLTAMTTMSMDMYTIRPPARLRIVLPRIGWRPRHRIENHAHLVALLSSGARISILIKRLSHADTKPKVRLSPHLPLHPILPLLSAHMSSVTLASRPSWTMHPHRITSCNPPAGPQVGVSSRSRPARPSSRCLSRSHGSRTKRKHAYHPYPHLLRSSAQRRLALRPAQILLGLT